MGGSSPTRTCVIRLTLTTSSSVLLDHDYLPVYSMLISTSNLTFCSSDSKRKLNHALVIYAMMVNVMQGKFAKPHSSARLSRLAYRSAPVSIQEPTRLKGPGYFFFSVFLFYSITETAFYQPYSAVFGSCFLRIFPLHALQDESRIPIGPS
jgi:hypothetical protein